MTSNFSSSNNTSSSTTRGRQRNSSHHYGHHGSTNGSSGRRRLPWKSFQGSSNARPADLPESPSTKPLLASYYYPSPERSPHQKQQSQSPVYGFTAAKKLAKSMTSTTIAMPASPSPNHNTNNHHRKCTSSYNSQNMEALTGSTTTSSASRVTMSSILPVSTEAAAAAVAARPAVASITTTKANPSTTCAFENGNITSSITNHHPHNILPKQLPMPMHVLEQQQQQQQRDIATSLFQKESPIIPQPPPTNNVTATTKTTTLHQKDTASSSSTVLLRAAPKAALAAADGDDSSSSSATTTNDDDDDDDDDPASSSNSGGGDDDDVSLGHANSIDDADAEDETETNDDEEEMPITPMVTPIKKTAAAAAATATGSAVVVVTPELTHVAANNNNDTLTTAAKITADSDDDDDNGGSTNNSSSNNSSSTDNDADDEEDDDDFEVEEGHAVGGTSTPGSDLALDYSAHACVCLEEEDLPGALQWYQRALLVYQSKSQSQRQALLGIIDTCNAAATLHNMGAIYNAMQQYHQKNNLPAQTQSSSNQTNAALQCYHDAEQLYRECQERLQQLPLQEQQDDDDDDALRKDPEMSQDDMRTKSSPSCLFLTPAQLQQCQRETVCLVSLIAETLHHRAAIYESTSVWDSVAALECHEACVELLRSPSDYDYSSRGDHDDDGAAASQDDGSTTATATISVICVDGVYFQQDCYIEDRLKWLTSSYQALAKLYRTTDTPQDALVAIQEWQKLLERHLKSKTTTPTPTLSTDHTAAEGDGDDDDKKWIKSLAASYKLLSEYYFGQQEMLSGVEALHKAMDLQMQIKQQQQTQQKSMKPSTTTTTSTTESSTPSSRDDTVATILSEDLLQQINSIGLAQEENGDYDQALACYEKVLLLVSRYLGEDHWEVAETLVKIGRVMELQGNVAGGLDLYHAAHTIYQAAAKNDATTNSHGGGSSTGSNSAGSNGDRKQQADCDNDIELDQDCHIDDAHIDDFDSALSTRAATESVVRIANVLMSQKRWQEAVEFLRELPQAKEWLSWLGDDSSSSSDVDGTTTTTTAVDSKTATTMANHSSDLPNTGAMEEPPPSVDQAIVFRELGRAYLGMGSLAKAKQCLLESARRLEGTDHEEDVFELLMHVEFCQKQEQKAALATARNRRRSRSRSRSRVRTRSRSLQCRAHSPGSSSLEEKGRITKDAVAAVLSPLIPTTPTALPEQTTMTGFDASDFGSDAGTDSIRMQSASASFVTPTRPKPQSPVNTMEQLPTRDEDDDPPLLEAPSNSTSTDSDDNAATSPSTRSSSVPPPPPLDPPAKHWADENPSSDSKSLGSLGTQGSADDLPPSKDLLKKYSKLGATKLKDYLRADTVDEPDETRDSFQLQRAKDIILKRVNQDTNETRSVGELSRRTPTDDGDTESDVVSGILVGLDIDIDLPPTSPTASSRDGKSFSGFIPARSNSTERPFDEATGSQASTRASPIDEHSTLGKNGMPKPYVFGRQTNYPAMVQERMMSTFQDEGSAGRQSLNQVPESLSDLTSTLGQSTSSSLPDVFPTSQPRTMSPLLHQRREKGAYLGNPPPPPPAPPSVPPSHIETFQSQPKGKTETPERPKHRGTVRISVANERDLSSPTMASPVSSPIQSLKTQTGLSSADKPLIKQDDDDISDRESVDDDDTSSDPFEGYDDFDEDDISEGEATPTYSGDSESEHGYTRFAKEDFTSDEEDSYEDGKYQARRRFGGSYLKHRSDRARKPSSVMKPNPRHDVVVADARQPNQAEDEDTKIEAFSSGLRESPVSPVASVTAETSPSFDPLGFRAVPKREASPTFDVRDSRPPPPNGLSTPPPKKSRAPSPSPQQKTELARDSPGNRIVKALSNSIRRRRNTSRGFDSLQPDAEEEKEETKEPATQKSSPVVAAAVADKTPSLPGITEGGELQMGPPPGPIQYISMGSPSFDDTVSQITFIHEDFNAKHSNAKPNNQWWGQLGLTTGKLEGWFPNSYLNQAVEAAEGFLSAKAIHAQVKSQPLDFESEEGGDDDDDDDDLIIRNPSTLPVAALAASPSDVVGACSDLGLFKSQDQRVICSPAQLLAQPNRRVNSTSSKQGSISPTLKLLPPASPQHSRQADTSCSVAAMKGNSMSIEMEIKRHEELLNQYELEDADDDDMTNRKIATTLFRLSILFIQSEKVDAALDASNKALRIQKLLGDISDASKSLHLLADIFVRKGEYESALSCYAEIQELELELYGYIHEETANTLNRIGGVLARQSKFSLAMEKHQEALRILKECHGEELRHPLVSQTLIHIGAVYYRERNSLTTARTNVDGGYTTFIEVGLLEVIGRAHEDRGSYKMAISFFEEKLQFLENKSKNLNNNISSNSKSDATKKSPEVIAVLEDVATTLNSLGMLCCRAGIFMEAIDYYDRALEVQKQIGCDKMHIATARVLTATVQFHLGYFRKALRLLQDALEELQIETGSDHETVAATWYQIGVVQVALCEYDDGMDALEEALRIQNKLLGKIHPATLRTRREIGNMYAIYESELDAAFSQFNDILAIQRRIHGHKHPNVAETLHSLGCAYARKNDVATAIKTLEECYYMRIDFLGADHPLQATTLHEIAQIHMKRQRYRKAIHICNAVLEIRKESLSERHIDVARALATKAACFVATGKFNDAHQSLMEALPMAEQAVGPRHPAVADIFVHIAGMHLRKCHFDEAKDWIRKALDIYQNSNLDEDHPSLKEAIALMERVDRDEMLCV